MSQVNWQSVTSTRFSRVAFVEDSNTLYVEFNKTGAQYKIEDFQQSDFESFKNSESMGKWWERNVVREKKFTAVKLTEKV